MTSSGFASAVVVVAVVVVCSASSSGVGAEAVAGAVVGTAGGVGVDDGVGVKLRGVDAPDPVLRLLPMSESPPTGALKPLLELRPLTLLLSGLT